MNHIALLLPSIDRLAGAERQVILLAKRLARCGWRVSLVVLTGDGGDAARDLETAGVSFFTLGMQKGVLDPRGWIRFRRWIKEQAPDVLHSHLPHATWMARCSRMWAPVRAEVDTIHTSALCPLPRRATYRATARLSDRVTAVSRAVAEACVSGGIAGPEQITLLPNGIDVNEWAPDSAERAKVRNELGLAGEFLWCAAGRLEPVKDYPTLLRAFAGLPGSAVLVIAGAGREDGRLGDLANQLISGGRVRFLGFQADVRRWMRAADGFVLSSLWEGLPVSLLEASACCLPSVATAVKGSCEVIMNGETGFLAEPGSVESLGRAMHRLMRMTPEDRWSMGLNARERVMEEFSAEAVLDRWEELYRDLLLRNPQPRRHASAIRAGQPSGMVSRTGS